MLLLFVTMSAADFPFPVSANTLAKLTKLNITNIWDLALHLPLRYEDETHITPIADAQN
ncbi:hypothetical protein SASC598J21_001390, partial [Snodgrassella alvi SCGC AB-598-J21]